MSLLPLPAALFPQIIHLIGSSLTFRFQLVLPRQKGPGRTLPNCITIILLNFLSSTDIVLFVYLFILLLQRSLTKAEFLVSNSVYTEKALKYLLIEWLNGGLNIVFLGLPFVLCLVLLVIIVSPNACGMEVLSFSCSLCFPRCLFFFLNTYLFGCVGS